MNNEEFQETLQHLRAVVRALSTRSITELYALAKHFNGEALSDKEIDALLDLHIACCFERDVVDEP